MAGGRPARQVRAGRPLRVRSSSQSCLCPTPFLEFHMGFFSASKTWRAPLQLIDCWLPDRHVNGATADVTRRGREAAPLLHKFRRAGWLAPAAGAPQWASIPSVVAIKPHKGRAPARRQAAAHTKPAAQARLTGDGRLWIAGRMADVCAELDRLAALDRRD